MFASVMTTKGHASKEEYKRVIDQLLSRGQSLPGFKGVLFLLDEKSGKGMTINLYESEEVALASVEARDRLRKEGPGRRQHLQCRGLRSRRGLRHRRAHQGLSASGRSCQVVGGFPVTAGTPLPTRWLSPVNCSIAAVPSLSDGSRGGQTLGGPAHDMSPRRWCQSSLSASTSAQFAMATAPSRQRRRTYRS